MLYQKYLQGELTDRVCKLALTKYWAENRQNDVYVPVDEIRLFVKEFLNEDIYFPFYAGLADIVPELHYIQNNLFVEYRTQPMSRVYIHYVLDDNTLTKASEDGNDEGNNYDRYDIEEMHEMFDGIYVSMFQLFHGENVQYYITENYSEEDEVPREHVTQSDTLSGKSEERVQSAEMDDRFHILNDIMLSISLQDETTAQQLTEEYLYQDFCARELFRVLS